MNLEPSQVCPFCAETIKVRAKVCPRCRQWLSRRSLRHPMVMGLLMLVFYFAFVWIGVSGLGKILDPGPRYAEVPGALQVLDSRMNWLDSPNGPQIYVTGILTNQSPVAWKAIEFECRSFDTNGAMVDVGNAAFMWTIQAHDDLAFRVRVSPIRQAAYYHSIKLLVSAAQNARSEL